MYRARCLESLVEGHKTGFKTSLLRFLGDLSLSASVLRIHMFLGLLDPDPDPDPLVRGMAPDPDSSIIKQK